MSSLVIVPTYIRKPEEFNVTLQTLQTLRESEPEVGVQVVDDCSPVQGFVDELETHAERLDFCLFRQPENGGFSRAVNVGLRLAQHAGANAILCNADIEFLDPGWVERMEAQKDSMDRPAAVVGALLLYPNGLIQHAGVYFSFLTRTFDHIYRFGPGDLPEAHRPRRCPVTGALQFIRHSTLEQVGLYDEDFRLGWEDVDYCLRVFDAGLECIYQPSVRAVHHESLFRGDANQHINDWTSQSWQSLMQKHQSTNMSRFLIEIV